jgi:hypothetical protein
MSDAFQVLENCPNCRVEGAVVALLDPAVVEGVSVEATCRLCGWHAKLGDPLDLGVRFGTPEEVLAALTDWATFEGEPDLVEFCTINLCESNPRVIADKILRREVVPSSFDVVAFLFPGMAAGLSTEQRPRPKGTGRAVVGDEIPFGWPTVTRHDDLPSGWPEAPPVADPIEVGRLRLPARVLAAVMLADGVIRPGERRFLDSFLGRNGLSAATDEDLRPWRPGELPFPDDPDPLLDAMIELAHVDGERDGTEWRVVRAFARHWGQPLDEIERRGQEALDDTAPPMQKLWAALTGLFVKEPE